MLYKFVDKTSDHRQTLHSNSLIIIPRQSLVCFETSAIGNDPSLHRAGERVVVVTHGTVLRSIYRRAVPKGGPAPKVQNASVSILHLFGGDDWVIKSWGDHSHLNQTEEKIQYHFETYGEIQNSGRQIWILCFSCQMYALKLSCNSYILGI